MKDLESLNHKVGSLMTYKIPQDEQEIGSLLETFTQDPKNSELPLKLSKWHHNKKKKG